ncbi:hypothetical protein ACNKHO_21055 [Shigella flexneri]
MARTTPIARYRNIGISAHIDAGQNHYYRTYSVLHRVNHKIGEVDDGATTDSGMEQEQERGNLPSPPQRLLHSGQVVKQYEPYRVNIIHTQEVEKKSK